MRVTTAKYGDVYIRWQYDDKMNPSITKAFLERKIGEKNKEVIKEVTVKKYHLDGPSKESARKFALDKLIRQCFSRKSNDEYTDIKNIWNNYLNRKQK